MGAWVIGHNLAGYSPEADTEAYETRDEAVSAFVTMVEYYADRDDDATWDVVTSEYDSENDVPEDEMPAMLATVKSILKDDGPNAPDLASKDYGMLVEDGRGRDISFWLQWSDDSEPDEEE